jgi:uncharacterized membrane protein YebE (DUF533 family)
MTGNKESYINLWRSVVGLTTVDGVVTEQEKEWLDKFLNNAQLDEEQRSILHDDIVNPKNPIQFIDKVTDAAHLSQLHHLANIVFKSDDFDYRESVYLEKIHKHIESKVDLMCAMRKSQDLMAEMEKVKAEQKSDIKGFFLHLVDYFRR